MTPKEKALEIYNKYEQLGKDFTRGVSMKEFAKQCALIAVDEISGMFSTYVSVVWYVPVDIEYWKEVKQEIEKL